MASQGTSSEISNTTVGCKFRFRWETLSQSITNNTSTIEVIIEAVRFSTGGWFTGTKNKNSYNVMGNVSGVFNAAGVPQGSSTSTWREQSRWTTTVSHNSDGTKTATIKVRVYQTPNPTYDEEISLSVTLDTIPRTTEIVAFSNITLSTSSPGSLTATLNRKSESFSHDITLAVNGINIRTWNGANPTLSLSATDRSNMLAAIPDKASANMVLTVATKNGTQIVGTRTKSATCSISTAVVPTISGVTITTTTPQGAISGKNRTYAIKDVSNVKVEYSGAAGAGSSVTSSVVKFGGKEVVGNPATSKIDISGSVAITITVTDKRGRTATSNQSVTVYDYAPLSAQVIYLGRPLTGDQNKLSATLKLTVAPITFSGATTNGYHVKIVATPVAGGASITSVNTTTNPGTANNTTLNYNPATKHLESTAYRVALTVTDDFSSVVINGALSTSSYPFVIGSTGIGVGGIPQGNRVLDVYDLTNNGIFVNGTLIPANIQSQVTTLSGNLGALTTTVGNIIETGTNANGSYIKYANGTLICTKENGPADRAITTAWGTGMFRSPEWSLGNWPMAFKNVPTVSVTCREVAAMLCRHYASSTTSAGTVQVARGTSYTGSISIHIVGIGTWK